MSKISKIYYLTDFLYFTKISQKKSKKKQKKVAPK